MDLIIVESPSKAKTISKYLKGKYRIDASAGHVRDLPERGLGVDVKHNFEPKYTVSEDKKAIVSRLKEEVKKAGKVYLATDPDREGEAISWHLQTVLQLDPNAENRIEFNEISQRAVEAAIQHPRRVNLDLVDAQQARRVLDRLVGYKLSPLLNRRIHSGLSAGRVQSVALKLVVEREREIQAFVPREYWELTVLLQDNDKLHDAFRASLVKKQGKKYEPATKEEVDGVLACLRAGSYAVSDVKKSVTKSHAPAPFTTSTLQQDASNKFGYSSPETMLVAQHLYEGIDTPEEGHIAFVTYIRTDSTRVSSEAQQAALGYIAEKYGKDYVPSKPNVYAAGKGAQDAHEAIRPIDVRRTPESVKHLLDKKHFQIYKLIYERFIASQMADAKYNSMQIAIVNGEYEFKATGRTMLFPGYTAVYQEAKANDEEESGKLLPDLKKGDPLTCLKEEPKQKFTKPPLRYTDASLVKEMDQNGIGRPSTYATIIGVLFKRHYVRKEGKYMVPEEVAFEITDLLEKYFKNVMDVKFTAGMEKKLDEIEDGNVDWHQIIADFYPPFEKQLVKATDEGTEQTDIPCEQCGTMMLRKAGRFGKYLVCPSETCGFKKNEPKAVEVSETPCPTCGSLMVVRSGRFGRFLACPNYPECKTTLPILNTASTETGVCPDCGKSVLPRQSKRGKLFYGCSGYPDCKFMSWDLPLSDKCPECGSYLLKKASGTIYCSSETCKYRVSAKKKGERSDGD